MVTSGPSTLPKPTSIGLPPLRPMTSRKMRPKSKQPNVTSYFQHKIQSANQFSICNTTSNKVGRIDMQKILTSDTFCVPIFQRRYCWTETQWQTLLEDASKLSCNGVLRQQHSLGRLTCTPSLFADNSNALANAMGIEGRSCILDGQQRFTTVTILLASIRDVLEQRMLSMTNQHVQEDWKAFQIHIDLINNMLFSQPDQMRAWLDGTESELSEGIELPFARLVPTFCDRWSYYAAILPSTAVPIRNRFPVSSSQSWHRPLRAKEYFVSKLQNQNSSSVDQLVDILSKVLGGFSMLYFPIDIHNGHEDGTEDMMVIYERLALRDATWCKPKRGQEYMSMDGADMIRNLLLGSCSTPSEVLDFYKTYWLPIEKLTSDECFGLTLPQLLRSFLDGQTDADFLNDGVAIPSGVIGGKVYADFQAFLQMKRQSLDLEAGNAGVIEKRDYLAVQTIGQQLLVFSKAVHEKQK